MKRESSSDGACLADGALCQRLGRLMGDGAVGGRLYARRIHHAARQPEVGHLGAEAVGPRRAPRQQHVCCARATARGSQARAPEMRKNCNPPGGSCPEPAVFLHCCSCRVFYHLRWMQGPRGQGAHAVRSPWMTERSCRKAMPRATSAATARMAGIEGELLRSSGLARNRPFLMAPCRASTEQLAQSGQPHARQHASLLRRLIQ